MMSRRLAFLMLVAGVLQSANSAPVRAKHSATQEVKQAQTVTTLPQEIFELSEVPANYRKGVNQAAVLRKFEALSNISKTEFEKSEEFQARQQSVLEVSPLAPSNGPLGFVVDGNLTGIEFGYDADTGQYRASQTYTIANFCRSPRPLFAPKPSVELCIVGVLGHKASKYVGQNAFGAKAEVDRESGTYLSVSIPFASRFFKDYSTKLYAFKDQIDFPSEQARRYKTSDLKMMLVGRIDGVKVIEGEGTIMRPRVDSPYDVFIQNKGLPFKLEAMIYFFQSDGKILAIRDFREPN